MRQNSARELLIIRGFAGGLNAEPPFTAENCKYRRTYAMIAAYAIKQRKPSWASNR